MPAHTSPSPPFRGEREGRPTRRVGRVRWAAPQNRLVGPPHPTLSPRPAGREGKGRVVRATLRRQIFEKPVLTLSPDSPAHRGRGWRARQGGWGSRRDGPIRCRATTPRNAPLSLGCQPCCNARRPRPPKLIERHRLASETWTLPLSRRIRSFSWGGERQRTQRRHIGGPYVMVPI
jgi:hypothetical protein